jgi:dGTPase
MAETLRHLRFPTEARRGRRYPEPSHPYRNDFQRDCDRLLHARAFRRLENKTQVFTPGLSDHFRNRLTHTIEVAQVARTVAGALELDKDLTEALALGHDIGHPPFAHAGEEELNLQMVRFGDHFDHNRHALRIVEHFEQRYAMFPGLNLTFEVREGLVKHSRDLEPGGDPLFEEYLPELRPPIEAQIIDLADEIAYNTADLDDAHGAGIIAIDEVRAEHSQFAHLYEAMETRFPGAPAHVRFHETLRQLFDSLVTGLIEGTRQTALQTRLTDHEDVRGYARRVAGFSPATHSANRSLKQFLHGHVYSSEALMAARKRSTSMIAELFQLYLDHPDRLPEPHRQKINDEPIHRVVCDYIAGMTDPFFERTYWTEVG